jgi:hypothetical protein
MFATDQGGDEYDPLTVQHAKKALRCLLVLLCIHEELSKMPTPLNLHQNYYIINPKNSSYPPHSTHRICLYDGPSEAKTSLIWNENRRISLEKTENRRSSHTKAIRYEYI